MNRHYLIGIVILLLLPGAADALRSPTGSLDLPQKPCCFSIDIGLHEIDPEWNCRLVFDRTGHQTTSVRIPDRTLRPMLKSRPIEKELPTARQWLIATRVLGRLAVRGIIHWIGFTDLHCSR